MFFRRGKAGRQPLIKFSGDHQRALISINVLVPLRGRHIAPL